MNSFFNMIENNGLKVIIAAHPKSDYKINPFEGREIYKYKTNELVKNSTFTMAHMSSSINFSVLHNKLKQQQQQQQQTILHQHWRILAQHGIIARLWRIPPLAIATATAVTVWPSSGAHLKREEWPCDDIVETRPLVDARDAISRDDRAYSDAYFADDDARAASLKRPREGAG